MSFRDPRLRRLRRAGGRLGGVRPGADTASGGGTTVRVGGVDQSSYLLAYSLTLRLGSFDFTLINPATVPVVGNMVYLLEPAWDGQVVSVGHKDVPRGTDKFYTIVATNAKVATTSAAPFALSDVADSVTSFPYRDLTITTSRTDAGNKTQGTFTTWQQGLWPGMTFSLTSANFSLSAQTYAISNVTVTWPVKSTVPQFAIEFGDAQIGLTQLAVNSGGLSTNADGSTSLADPLGNLIFNSASGFGPAWRRFMLNGVYNGDFAVGPADPVQVITNVINELPSWSFVRIGGTAINMNWVSDPSAGSGYVMRISMVAGVADDEAYLEQLVPIIASRNRVNSYRLRAYYFNGSASASPGGVLSLQHQYLRRDGSTATGAVSVGQAAMPTTADNLTIATPVPADAYFIRIRVGFKRDTALVGTTASVDLAEVRLEGGLGTGLLVADGVDSATYGTALIRQSSGALILEPDFTAVSAVRAVQIGSTALFRYGASAFPASPTTYDQFYRTDLGGWFYYDGTRWLSSTLYHMNLMTQTAIPIAATVNGMHRTAMPPLSGGSDIWFYDSKVSFYVVGGTALGASHKWVGTIVTDPAATTIDTININSGSSDVWRTATAAINVSGVASTQFALTTSWTKTGTPGTLYILHAMTYRIVAT